MHVECRLVGQAGCARPACLPAPGELACRCGHVTTPACAAATLCVQEFFARDMGLSLEMKPNYEDFSCQFRRAVIGC